MQPVFTVDSSEYYTMEYLEKILKKGDGNSFYIPTSRQNKGVDFVIHNNKTNNILRIQVKNSRVYPPRKSGKGYKHRLWINNFLGKYEKNNADYYILYGKYYEFGTESTKEMILCFPEADMFKILKQLKTKKEQKREHSFYVAFNNENEVFITRGLKHPKNVSKYLIENKINELKSRLEH